MNRFTWLMIRFILVMVPLVFVINGLTKGDWEEAFFFAMAVAVGLTPEMLPDDRDGLPLQGRAGDGAQEGHRQAAERDPEPRRDGRPLHRQDRHADQGQDHPGEALRRDGEGRRARCCTRLPQQPLPDRPEEPAGPGDPRPRGAARAPQAIEKYAQGRRDPFDFSRRLMSVVVEDARDEHRLICKGALGGGA